VLDSNEGPAYKTHKETTPDGGIGIVRPSPHISPATPRRNKVNAYVGKSIYPTLCPFTMVSPENFPPAKLGEKLGSDHPEDSDVGECDPGYPPEDI
jgi:hypothetical protein